MISATVGSPVVAIVQSVVVTAGTDVRVLLVIVLSWKKIMKDMFKNIAFQIQDRVIILFKKKEKLTASHVLNERASLVKIRASKVNA